MTFRLQKIDELSFRDHYHLSNTDICWYFGDYTAYKDWSFSETNRLIKNFKKKMSLQGTNQWPHKINAITQVGHLFASIIKIDNLQNTVFVPIPPSKIEGDPDYDPRVTLALEAASKKLSVQLPIVECLKQTCNTNPDHESDSKRLHPEDRAKTYKLIVDCIPEDTKTFILVDDVLTTGSHFKGAEIAIRDAYPTTIINGLFIARRVHEFPFEPIAISDFI